MLKKISNRVSNLLRIFASLEFLYSATDAYDKIRFKSSIDSSNMRNLAKLSHIMNVLKKIKRVYKVLSVCKDVLRHIT